MNWKFTVLWAFFFLSTEPAALLNALHLFPRGHEPGSEDEFMVLAADGRGVALVKSDVQHPRACEGKATLPGNGRLRPLVMNAESFVSGWPDLRTCGHTLP